MKPLHGFRFARDQKMSEPHCSGKGAGCECGWSTAADDVLDQAVPVALAAEDADILQAQQPERNSNARH
ncbi:MAG TPA: hypothetical protein VMH04_24700 [Candidatus Solibacter sp.]|nr:hypothetical protein [Candidatus Solibacter sp.]